jgi:hypothetical protein
MPAVPSYDEVVARLVGEVGVVLDACNLPVTQQPLRQLGTWFGQSDAWSTRGGKRYWSPAQVAQKGSPAAMVPVGPQVAQRGLGWDSAYREGRIPRQRDASCWHTGRY